MNQELLCKDCAHAIYPSIPVRLLVGLTASRCSKEFVRPKFNPVTGTQGKGEYMYAAGTRLDSNICGPDATAWTPRHKHGLFKLIKHIK